ncbi:MAG: hypothetical protein J6386_04355 [Candidatus Synoicihabitans palmerolidicus]|nr:hypothetical protein [Candidatus Synoicihabitans palmerolidicus]
MTVELSPAEMQRVFLAVPAGVERMHLDVKHTAADSVARRFFIQAFTPSAESHQGRFKVDEVAWVDEGERFQMNIPVQAGGVTELALNQYFYSHGETALELDMQWVGVGAGHGTVTMEPNQGWLPVELNPTVDGEVNVETSLEQAVSVYLPKETTDFYDDERSVLPPTPRNPGPKKERRVRLSYALEFKKPMIAALLGQQDYDLSDGIRGGRVMAVHESGEVLYNQCPDGDRPIDFQKGKTTVIADFAAFRSGLVDTIKTLPLRVGQPIKPAKSLGVRPHFRGRFDGNTSSHLSLKAGRDVMLMLADTVVGAMAKLEPKPDYVVGEMTFSDDEENEIVSLPLRYFVGGIAVRRDESRSQTLAGERPQKRGGKAGGSDDRVETGVCT